MHVASAHTEKFLFKNMLHALIYSWKKHTKMILVSFQCLSSLLHCSWSPKCQICIVVEFLPLQRIQISFSKFMPNAYIFWPPQVTFIASFCFFDFPPIKCWDWILSFIPAVLVQNCFCCSQDAFPLRSMILLGFPAYHQVFNRRFKFHSHTFKSFLWLVPCSGWPFRN